MSTPVPPTQVWWTRPGRVLPLVAVIVLIVALLTPQQANRASDTRLSTTLAGPSNARVLGDLSARLGWSVVRDTLAGVTPRGNAIRAVLSPPIPLSAEEAHTLLESVRAGGALLLVLNERDALSDSLGVAHHDFGGVYTAHDSLAESCSRALDLTPPRWSDGRIHLFPLRWLRGAPAGVVGFAPLVRDTEADSGATPDAGHAAMGFAYGQGRVVVISDPDLLRNDVLRRCKWGADVLAVQMLEWLRAGGERPRSMIVYDEYHQGFGHRPGMGDVVFPFLADHPVGRTVLAVIAAGLLLLLSKAPRPIIPVEVDRIERRDPLEQVDALSHAYEQVRATRTIVARLVRGVRWRVHRTGPSARAASDADFLEQSVSRYPQLGDDVALITQALERPVTERELPAVGAALHRVEETLTRTTS